MYQDFKGNEVIRSRNSVKKIEDVVTSRLNRKMAIQLIQEVDDLYDQYCLKSTLRFTKRDEISRELYALILDNEIENVNFKIEFGRTEKLINRFFSDNLDEVIELMNKYKSYVRSHDGE